MVRLRVILVEPKYEGNVGAVARLCKNFRVEELVLVNPPSLGAEAKERAVGAWPYLERARRAKTFEAAVRDVGFLVGTTAKVPDTTKAHLRNPLEPADLVRRLARRKGLVGIAFGREDFGLLTPELEECDLTLTIPSDDGFRSLNLSHAVAVVLYELYKSRRRRPPKKLEPMEGEMRRALHATWDTYIGALNLPPHRALTARRVIRKMLGRAVPSKWEFFVMMGLLQRGMGRMGLKGLPRTKEAVSPGRAKARSPSRRRR